ncbi:MAG: hypothetical protein ACOCX5_01685 [Chloroflexota bacterium]
MSPVITPEIREIMTVGTVVSFLSFISLLALLAALVFRQLVINSPDMGGESVSRMLDYIIGPLTLVLIANVIARLYELLA